MKLKKVEIHNFKNFKGHQTIDLDVSKKKNVVLVHADNGFGKTAFLESILFCFYGINSEGKNVIYEQLMNNEARAKGETHLEVIIDFVDDDDVPHRLRRMLFHNDKTSLKLIKDIYGDSKNIENVENTINEILPKTMAPYFFFGGETTKKFLDKRGNKEIEKAVKNILGCNAIERARDTLKDVATHYTTALAEQVSDDELKIVITDIKKYEDKIDETKQKIDELENNLDVHEKKHEEIKKKLGKLENAKYLYKQLDNLNEMIQHIKGNLKENTKNLNNWIGKESHKLLLKPLSNDLSKFKEKHEKETGGIAPPYNETLLNKLMKEKVCICGSSLDKTTLEKIKKKIVPAMDDNDKDIHNARERIFSRIGQAENSSRITLDELTNIYKQNDRFMTALNDHRKKVSEIETQLEGVGRKDQEIQALQNKLKDNELKMVDVKARIYNNKQTVEEGAKILADLKKKKNKLEGSIDQNSDINKYYEYSSAALDQINKELEELSSEAKEIIEQKMNEIFKKTTKLKITVKIKDNFSIDYKIADEIVKGSEGYEVYIGIVFVLALISFNKLRITAQDERSFPGVIAPLVLDAPTAKLGKKLCDGLCDIISDANHSDQIILLLNTKETLNSNLRENFERNIEKEYLMTFYQKTSDTGKKEDNYIIINNKKHEWYFYGQKEKCTKIEKIN